MHMEDRSKQRYGDVYNSLHSVHGTANYIGSVVHATLGTNPATPLQLRPSSKQSFCRGTVSVTATRTSPTQAPAEAILLWGSLPKQRDLSGQQSEYLEGSREDTILYAMSWGEDPNSGLALLIHGAAGLGKSTLARQLTHRLHATGRLAASVTLSGIPTDARGPESVVKLIAREIGEKHPEAIPTILEAIRLCKGATVEDHFERFLKNVVCSLKCSHPLIVIFDATDEWESYASLIRAHPLLSSSGSSLKFILLGQLDPRGHGFEDASICLYPLQPVSTVTMERYFSHHFNSVRWDSGRRPPPSQTAQLAELANGLCIWASITLEAILHSGQRLGENESLAGLYRQALVWLSPDSDGQGLARQYLGATLVLQQSLPLDEFSELVDLPAHAAEETQGALTALQIRRPVGEEGSPLVYPVNSIFHLSLLEYLQSMSASSGTAFRVSAFDAHSQLAKSCLKKLPDPPRKSGDRTSLHLTPEEKYVVKYLAAHIHNRTPSVKPGSVGEWEQTKHCNTLQEVGTAKLFRWGSLLLDLVRPGFPLKEEDYADNDAGRLMQDVAVALGPDAEVRSFPIPCLEVAVRLQPEGVEAWGALGWAYRNAAFLNKDIDAGEKAVLAYQNTLGIAETLEHSDRSSAMFSLATSLHTRFELIGQTGDLDRSISLHREVLALRPPGHEARADSLNRLAIALDSRLAITSSISDANKVIHLHGDARPPGHAHRFSALRSLASSLHSRFELKSPVEDLNKAISLCREHLELCPPGHVDRGNSLNSVAWVLLLRYEDQGDRRDLEESISLSRESITITPATHRLRTYVAIPGPAVAT
ncbi:hypothetical protein FA13DRAFT_1780210 [Coprinellus micaceus]|uniref:Nephrocystin 3-like N-terminal domain-containing protein n=1 Tax=Coprinellus micaceus TaxID=71717 RepID=A0A4Y7SE29_COPMI|nr:hypothetical protein FA13DRAFT_1780210 [Coprinellus micaceus]